MKRSLAVTFAIGAVSISLLAQGSANARFQYERMVDAATAGPQRLDVDVSLLSGSQPFTVSRRGDRAIASNGLNDLRFFASGSNTEIPYLLIPPSADAPVFLTGRILPITATELPANKASGFEIDLQEVADINAVDLDAVPAPFLKRFRLEGSGDRQRWTQLVGEGTAFNLPAEGLLHTRIEFPAGPYRYLRVTWDDTNSARVPAPDRVMVRRVTLSSPGPMIRSAVSVTRRDSEPGRSRFRLTLPAPRLPIVALELTVAGGNLLRNARVLEPGLVGQEARPRLLGQTRLTRVVRDAVSADALQIPISQPTEPQLDLVVDDGDNPPLALEGVTAIYAEMPWIYLEAPAAGSIIARYGDAKLPAPHYDLEAARETITLGQPSAAAVTVPHATWRPQPAVTLAAEPEGLAMPDTGGALAAEGFGYVRDIPEGAAGLITVPLDAAVMAHSGIAPRRFRDLRIVDRANVQIPYLLELRDEPLIVDAILERRDLPTGVQAASTRASSYMVRVPYSPLPDAQLVMTTRARVFQRVVTLGVVTPATDRQAARFNRQASQSWTHADQAVSAPALSFPLPDSSSGELFLLIEEGDNQPLPIEKATVLMPAYAVRLYRQANLPLRMLYGKDNLSSPQYDLQLLGPQVLGRPATEVISGPEQQLGAAGSGSTFDLVPPALFWSVLGGAVLVLLTLVVRLVRSSE